jgi:probable non-F420 flavinoid oxidoreductase
MTRIGFHASHEQISPRQLLADVQHAERAGFAMAMCSDHFSPWSTRQGHSGYTWAWLGAALATTTLELGCVSAPGQRYHPAVHAQRIATLGQMFPGRFWVALGSGEASNEHITGAGWPRKEVRTQRLEECVDVIRRLLGGEEVSHDGLVTVDRARLWVLPDPLPLHVGPAVSVESAARVAAWADGLVTVNQPVDVLRDVLAAYRDAGGRGRTVLQVHLSWAPTEDEALATAHDQWAGNVFGPPVSWDLDSAEAFDVLWSQVAPDAVRDAVRVSADLAQHREWLAEYAELGFDDLYLHHVGQEQAAFIEAFGEQVLPAFDGTGS